MSLVTIARRGRVAVVTFNAPKRLNALTAAMGDEFKEKVGDLDCTDLGAVVLTGEGRAFSAGGDIQFLKDRHEDSPTRNAAVMRRFYSRFLDPIRNLPVPIIAAVNGPAIGAGMCVATACDYRVAASSAKLGYTFVSLGLHPGMGATHFLPSVVGFQHATRLLLTGDVISPEEALRIGLVGEVVDDDSVVDAAVAVADRMASQAPGAVRTCVRSLRLIQDEGLDRALWTEANAQGLVYNSADMGAGLDAIVAKAEPEFSGYEPLQD